MTGTPDRVGGDSAYLITTAVSVCGSAIGILAATGATTAAGGTSSGAMYTGVYTAAVMLASALAVPYAPRLANRMGTRRLFVLGKAAGAVAWVAAGVLLLLGAPAFPVLVIAAPFLGLPMGATGVVTPLLTKAYLDTGNMSAAYARVSVYSGVAWGVGALGGGYLLGVVPLGWGLVLNGALTVPLVWFTERHPPPAELAEPPRPGRPWRDIRTSLAESRTLRLVALLGCAVTVFVAPLSSLIVPITQDLRHQPLLVGAGLLLAAMAAGEFMSPRVVGVVVRGRSELTASALAAVGAGLSLVVFSVTALLLTDRTELGTWALIGIAFGALRYASRALTVGAASEARGPEHATGSLAALTLTAGLAAPVGTLLWSALIGGLGAEAATLTGGVAGAATAGLVLLAARRPAG
ncbi:MAG: MFS transporter [Microthrixaceae bacterium]